MSAIAATTPLNRPIGFYQALWIVRTLLLASVVLHITASVQLWLLKQRARPQPHVKKDDVPTSYAARTMIWSGPIIEAFVIFHVPHLTTGSILPMPRLRYYKS